MTLTMQWSHILTGNVLNCVHFSVDFFVLQNKAQEMLLSQQVQIHVNQLVYLQLNYKCY